MVRSSEYNSRLISWLQLQVEGKIAAQVGIDWCSVVESARIRWIQLSKQNELLTMNNEAKLKEFINSIIEKQFKQLEEKLDKKIEDISVGIAEAVVQSLKSSKDVHQKISSRIQKWKKNN